MKNNKDALEMCIKKEGKTNFLPNDFDLLILLFLSSGWRLVISSLIYSIFSYMNYFAYFRNPIVEQ